MNRLVITMFQKIEVARSRLADQVYDQILTAINQGMIAPSERIVQATLAEQLQVSRTPIREALFRLEQEGTLVASDRGGFTIRMASPREVVEIYQARQAIEGHCAAMLARNADAADLSGIEAVIRANEATAPDSAPHYYDANRQIHRAFVAATDNQYLLEMFDAMWNRSLSFGAFRLLKQDQLRATLNGHLLLLDAILTGDPLVAEHAMKEHISDGLQQQLRAMKGI